VTAVRAQDVTKSFGRTHALQGVTFTAGVGVTGLLGPNGAGKTTLLRMLATVLAPDSGSLQLLGRNPQDADDRLAIRRRLGYLPETPPLYPDMTVRDYLLFVGRIRGVAAKALRAQVDTAMEKARVADVATRFCGKLSKGYKQRVGLAQAILHNPEVLILDEPTAGLDPKQIMETRDLIKGLAGSHTIILSTHILPEVSQTCERVVIINKGKVVAIDTPEALTERIQGNQTIFVQVDAPTGVDVAGALGGVPGVSRVTPVDQRGTLTSFEIDCHKGEDRRREVARLVVSSDWGLVELRPSRLSLEEIFLQLTTDEAKSAAPDAAA